jgi:hypothetical protein
MKSIPSARKSSRGRPRVDATPVNTRFPPDELAKLDAWIARQRDIVSRPEGIRRLVELGLQSALPIRVRSKKAVARASKMAGEEIDRLSQQSATPEERESRKRRLLKGPKEFRDMRGDLSKPKR